MARFLFNFKAQFAPLVLSGAKRQTIRRTRADGRRPVAGDIACCYQGLRTSKARLLLERPVIRCASVRMHIAEGIVIVDGHRLSPLERQEFARADGFSCGVAMLAWFEEQYGPDDFDGFLTEWGY